MTGLRCTGISRSYGKKQVLRNISLEVPEGGITGILGDNGSGKSTLAGILAGVIKPESGEIFLNEEKTDRMSNLAKAVGYMPQTDPLPGRFTVKECLSLWCVSSERLAELSGKYELDELLKKRTDRLSGGERRRVSFVCALASDPGVIILDEPTSALDERFSGMIRSDIIKLRDEGKGILLITHNSDELRMCNMRYRMSDGINERI